MFRFTIILVLFLATLTTGCLGLSNGLVLHMRDDGALHLDAPRVQLVLSHGAVADHHLHDPGDDAEHRDLHDLAVADTDFVVAIKQAKAPRLDIPAPEPCLVGPFLYVAASLGLDFHPPVISGLGYSPCLGGAAHTLASLRSVILLV